MMNQRFLIVSLSVSVLLSSCVVSKKKYEELEYAKRRSDSKVRALDKENTQKDEKISSLNGKLDQTLAEFNEMKNSMAESNAMKTSEIDALSTELMGMASDTVRLKEKLSSTLELYRRAKNQNVSHSAKIENLESRLGQLKDDSLQLAKDLKAAQVELNWASKKVEDQKKLGSQKVKQKENEIAALKKELDVYKGKASWLRKVKAKNEEEIERLTNQLNLYKKELDKALKK
jgi:peptidoglycan hydrolase CwlO-like protein